MEAVGDLDPLEKELESLGDGPFDARERRLLGGEVKQEARAIRSEPRCGPPFL